MRYDMYIYIYVVRQLRVKVFLEQVMCSVLTERSLIRTGSIDEREAGKTTARKCGTSRMVETGG